MKRLYFLGIASVICVTTAFSQAASTGNCTQVLRLMRSTYEQGRLHELPRLSEACLAASDDKKGFTREERKEAYRLLTLTYIYLEEPEQADKAMLKFLETEHFYEPNSAIDPAEFIALYNKFRHDPVYRIGIKIGGNITQPSASQFFAVANNGAGQGSYALTPNFQVTAMFEWDLPIRGKFNHKIVIAPELAWVNRGITYSNENLHYLDDDGKTPISKVEFALSQQWLDLNGIVQYKFVNTLARQTYVGLGPSVSMLLTSSNLVTTDKGVGAQKFSTTGPEVKDKSSYNQFVYSVVAVVGIKLKFGELYVTADARYQYGLTNVVDPGTRTNSELAFDYEIVYNNYRQCNFAINVGVLIPKFSPKKLIK